jgi:hypothetical protein
MIKFLYAAYGITWIIHLVYAGILARGFRRVREEGEELRRK